ncbi:MAG: D-alanine--D-alanine ligase [Firmicutes bacterium]|nr:D-alanine--D-alanine ligase [Bacillota bacterium]
MKIAVFFGGKSCEHNISLITGAQVMRALASRHEVIPVYIDKAGAFFTGKELAKPGAFKKGANPKKIPAVIRPASDKLYSKSGKALYKIDAAVLATHGFGGEDGCLQGLLTLAGIPFTGSGVAASALGMDKILMKKLFERAFLPTLPYVALAAAEYRDTLSGVVENIKKELRFPMIVKPAGGGSSIGISVAHGFPELFEAINAALLWDNAAVVENALPPGFTELNCAVLGNGNELIASEIEQPVSAEEFLTFREKYLANPGGKSGRGGVKGKGGAGGARKKFPADIPEALSEKVKSYAKRAFSAVGASGVARVDFLYDGEVLYVNEINTIPGALSYYLFSHGPHKMTFPDLLDRLVGLAIKVKTEADKLTYVYEPV